jgi:hypothetical protein
MPVWHVEQGCLLAAGDVELDAVIENVEADQLRVQALDRAAPSLEDGALAT